MGGEADEFTFAESPLGNANNAAGRTIATTDANGRKATTTFDAVGQQIAVTNALGNITTSVFDATGRSSALVDARGNRHSFSYDVANQRIASIDSFTGIDFSKRKQKLAVGEKRISKSIII